MRDVDAVILLSGIDSLTSMVDDSRDLDAVLGDLKPGSALVEVTTMAVFGDAGDHPVTEDDTPVVPADLDPVAACEIRVLAAEDWLRGIVVRPGLVYGDGGGLALAPGGRARPRRAEPAGTSGTATRSCPPSTRTSCSTCSPGSSPTRRPAGSTTPPRDR